MELIDYYKILDELLLLISEESSLSKEQYDHKEKHIWGTQGREISQSEKKSLFDKLIREGYLNEDRKLTVEGFMFIQDGMYDVRNRGERLRFERQESDRRVSKRNEMILAFGSVGIVIVEIFVHWKELAWLFCSYCH